VSRQEAPEAIVTLLNPSFSSSQKIIAQMGFFVYCLLAPEKTIDAEPRLEAA